MHRKIASAFMNSGFFVVGCAMLALSNYGAKAADTVKYEAPCAGTGIFSAPEPLRQTVVILDEASVGASDAAQEKNTRITRTILQIVDGLTSQPSGNAALRERVAIFLASANGRELAPIFIGCAATWSQDQINNLAAGESTMTTFITGGVRKQIENARAGYETALAGSIAAAIRTVAGENNGEPGAIIRALQSNPQFIDPSGGVPRIVMITPFRVSDDVAWPSEQVARKAGFEFANGLGLDLRRAEVHVIGVPQSAPANLRAFAEALFLPLRGFLAGWRADGLPSLQRIPIEVRVFGGTVKMGEISAPVQVRIANDEEGNLVNSWIEVTTGQSKATPITGKILCTDAMTCEVHGDGRYMGQAWNPDTDNTPEFSPYFAWSGLRFFEMKIKGDAAVIKIWDPQAKIDLGDGEQDNILFEVAKTVGQTF